MRKPRLNLLSVLGGLVAVLAGVAQASFGTTGQLGDVTDFQWADDSKAVLIFAGHMLENDAYPDNRYVLHVCVDGQQTTTLSDLPTRGVPSPDGARIAFIKDEGFLCPVVYVADPALTECRKVFERTFPKFAVVVGLAWIPGSLNELLVWCVSEARCYWSGCWIVDTDTCTFHQVWSARDPKYWNALSLARDWPPTAVDPPFRFSSDGRLLLAPIYGAFGGSWKTVERVIDIRDNRIRLRRPQDRFPVQPPPSVEIPRGSLFRHFAYAAGTVGWQYAPLPVASAEPRDWKQIAAAIAAQGVYGAMREQDVLLCQMRARSTCFGESPDIVYSVDRRYLYRCSLSKGSTEVLADFRGWKARLGITPGLWAEPVGSVWYDPESSSLVIPMAATDKASGPLALDPAGEGNKLIVTFDPGTGLASECKDAGVLARYREGSGHTRINTKIPSPDRNWYANFYPGSPLRIQRAGTGYEFKVPPYMDWWD